MPWWAFKTILGKLGLERLPYIYKGSFKQPQLTENFFLLIRNFSNFLQTSGSDACVFRRRLRFPQLTAAVCTGLRYRKLSQISRQSQDSNSGKKIRCLIGSKISAWRSLFYWSSSSFTFCWARWWPRSTRFPPKRGRERAIDKSTKRLSPTFWPGGSWGQRGQGGGQPRPHRCEPHTRPGRNFRKLFLLFLKPIL